MPRRRKSRVRRPKRPSLPDALRDPRCYGSGVKKVRLVETHLSWVFLTGRYAYKVKKPVKLTFVDFSTLERRKRFCAEELRVNRRLAPDLYLGVVPIGGAPAAPRVGRRPAFEYAVKMLEFPSAARLDRRVAANRVSRAAVAEFGERLASFHCALPRIRGIRGRDVSSTVLRNVDEIGAWWGDSGKRTLAKLRTWTEQQCVRLAPVLEQRAAEGAHRECHGDLHLQNLLARRGRLLAFDALEFDRALRDIDVISETAFLAMDFQAHGRLDLAHELLNRYLEVGGDYRGIDVLRFYLVYRALVRAKVALIKRAQSPSHEDDSPRYVATALDLTAPARPLLAITHGLSGSGKTTVTNELVGLLPAIRARSDLERKRLHGLAASARSGSGLGAGMYTARANRRSYAALAEIADRLLRNGHNALIDAAFLRRSQRLEFLQVASANDARFAILDCQAAPAELRRRILTRARGGSDASEADLAVLDRQLRTAEPLDPAERRHSVVVDTERAIRYPRLAARLRKA